MQKWGLKAVFQGYSDERGGFELELEEHLSVNLPNWGRDNIMYFNVSYGLAKEIYISAPLYSGGIIEYNVKKNELDIHP